MLRRAIPRGFLLTEIVDGFSRIELEPAAGAALDDRNTDEPLRLVSEYRFCVCRDHSLGCVAE